MTRTGGARVTPPLPRHLGGGLNLSVELAVMEAIVIGLQLLAEDPTALGDMVERTDSMASTEPDDWRAMMLAELRAMVDPNSDQFVSVFAGFDAAIAHMPSIHVENAGGGENTAEAEVGNVLGVAYSIKNAIDPGNPYTRVALDNPRGLSPPVPLADNEHIAIEHTTRGVGMTTQVLVAMWDPSPERALLLQAAVRWALSTMEGHLHTTHGIHEFSWSEGAISPSQEMQPRPVSYVPTLTLTLHWTNRRTTSEVVPNRFRVTTRFH